MRARAPLWIALGLAAATLVFYAGLFGNAFVNYDDDLYVTGRPEVLGGLTPEGLSWAWASFQGANWFPLTRLSWQLDAEIFGPDARGFHATSLLLHGATTLLLFAALLRLTRDLGPSAFVAAVFALHPLHVESVAWVAARKDVLAGLFFALALLLHERVARGPRPRLAAAGLFAATAAGLLSKPVLVTLPCVLLLLDEWPLGRLRDAEGRLDAARVGRALAEKLPLFALAAAASWMTLRAQAAGGALQDAEAFPLWLRLGNFAESLTHYVSDAFWPRDLAVFYPHPLGRLDVWRVSIGVWLFAGVSWWALRRIRSLPWVAVGWLWFVGMLIPSSGILQVGQAARADRYTYLPLIGLAIAVAWTGRELARRWPALGTGLGRGAVVALLLLGFLTWDQVAVWRDSRTLFEHALEVTERNHVASINLGLALAGNRRQEEAEPHLTEAIAIAPASALARGIRGEVRMSLGRAEEAEADFRSALRLQPGRSRWSFGLGRALLEQDDPAGALAVLQPAVAAEPDAPEGHALLAFALLNAGQRERGRAHLERALADPPLLRARVGARGLATAHAQMAVVEAEAGDAEEAMRHFEHAIRLEPEEATHHAQLAMLLHDAGREAEAVAVYLESIARGSRSVRVYNNLAWILATSSDEALRDPRGAIGYARQAADRSEHRDAGVLDTLATAYAAAGRDGEALNTARKALALAERRSDQRLADDIRRRFPGLSSGNGAAPGRAGA